MALFSGGLTTGLSLTLALVQPLHPVDTGREPGLDSSHVPGITAEAIDAVGVSDDLAPLAEEGGALADTNETVSVAGNRVTFEVGTSAPLVLDLPVSDDVAPALTSAGTATLSGSDALHFEVQSLEDGTGRVVSVADEAYSNSEEHRYEYSVAELQDGMNLVQTEGGAAALTMDRGQVAPISSSLAPEAPGHEDIDWVEAQAEAAAAASELDAVETAPIDPSSDPIVVAFQQPWAVDAEGRQLPTRLEVDGSKLVQVVDTTDATFPVVSDPIPLLAIGLGAAARALAPHAIRAFAATTIRGGLAYTTRGGFSSFRAFKAAHGTRSGYQWHHIVEQSTISKRGWATRAIHNPRNLVQIPTGVHQKCVNRWMATKGVKRFGAGAGSHETMRTWVHRQGYTKQHQIGVALLRHCGVNI